ncbi:MAG: SgcJ/EcaC family oxidoreductase [Betaproteobacteria bacterium]|nr:SgcJ/EcaC family oxidoreductase [Betaproteobacteria bacterium]
MAHTKPLDAVQAFFRAFNDGDIDAVVAFYEPTAVLVAQPGQLAEGTAAIREALQGFLALKPTLTAEQTQVVMAGNIALSIVKWTLKGSAPNGEAVQMEGTTADVLHRQADGSWLFAIDNPWGAKILG